MLLLIGLAAGVLSGLAGIGGGTIIVPALVFFMGYTQHQAQGVSLTMFLLPIGFLGVYTYYKGGHISRESIQVALIMCATFVFGSYFGSKLAVNINQEMLKKIFGVFLFLLSLKMIFWK
jgi:uncharacterized protein